MYTLCVRIIVFSILLTPLMALAAPGDFFGPVVPACTEYGFKTAVCQACNLVQLADNLLKLFVSLGAMAAALMMAYAGFLYVTAASHRQNLDSAKTIFWNALLGLIFILIAFLIVDLVLRGLTSQSFAVWTEVQCVWKQTTTGSLSDTQSVFVPTSTAPRQGGTPATGGVPIAGQSCVAISQQNAQRYGSTPNCDPARYVRSSSSVRSAVSRIRGDSAQMAAIEECSRVTGAPVEVLVAIGGIETNGNPNGCDPVNGCQPTCRGGYGVAGVSCGLATNFCNSRFGTNKSYCNNIAGSGNQNITSKLRSDYRLSYCSAGYGIQSLYARYGDYGIAAAAYNSTNPNISVGPSQSCPNGSLVIHCPISTGTSDWPYCGVTCAYHDNMNNFIAAQQGGTTGYRELFEQFVTASKIDL